MRAQRVQSVPQCPQDPVCSSMSVKHARYIIVIYDGYKFDIFCLKAPLSIPSALHVVPTLVTRIAQHISTHPLNPDSFHFISTHTTFHQWRFNPLTAGVAYNRVFVLAHFVLAHYVPLFKYVKDKIWHQSARFENSWPPFCQIWIIFTHLKLWIASARHNFKWVKIQIE